MTVSSPVRVPPRQWCDGFGSLHRWCRLILGGVSGLVLASCAGGTARVDLSPVNPVRTGEHHVGQFVWYDLVTEDVEAAKHFYGQLFGWSFEDVAGDGIVYTVIHHQGVPIGGMAPIEDDDINVSTSRWLSLMSVEDVDAAVSLVRRVGGTVNMEPWDNPTRGRLALVTDPQGAMVALVRSIGGDPPNRSEDSLVSNRWMWTELWVHEPAEAIGFYQNLAGYELESVDVGAVDDYRTLVRDGHVRGGVNRLPWAEVQANWLPYVKVDDPQAVARRAEQLGGTVLIPPLPELRSGSVGLLVDPSGAVFAIQRWPVDGGTGGGAR